MKSEALHKAACAMQAIADQIGVANMQAEPTGKINWSNLFSLLAELAKDFLPLLLDRVTPTTEDEAQATDTTNAA